MTPSISFYIILTLTVTYSYPSKPKYSPVPFAPLEKPIYSVYPRQPRKIEFQGSTNTASKIAQGCRIENKTMHDIEFKEAIEKKCVQKFK